MTKNWSVFTGAPFQLICSATQQRDKKVRLLFVTNVAMPVSLFRLSRIHFYTVSKKTGPLFYGSQCMTQIMTHSV